MASGFDFGGVVTNPLREGGTGPKTKLKPYHRDPHWSVAFFLRPLSPCSDLKFIYLPLISVSIQEIFLPILANLSS